MPPLSPLRDPGHCRTAVLMPSRSVQSRSKEFLVTRWHGSRIGQEYRKHICPYHPRFGRRILRRTIGSGGRGFSARLTTPSAEVHGASSSSALRTPSTRCPRYITHGPQQPHAISTCQEQAVTNAGHGTPSLDQILQPNTKPISQEQLVVKVKDVRAGLVMVESKCINEKVHPLGFGRRCHLPVAGNFLAAPTVPREYVDSSSQGAG